MENLTYLPGVKRRGCFFLVPILAALLFLPNQLLAQSPTSLTLEMNKQGHKVSPNLYGIMTEEINYSYDGGLYAELIRNRSFKEDAHQPKHWLLVKKTDANADMKLTYHHPLSKELRRSLKLEVSNVGDGAGIANTGYWGIPVYPNTTYTGSFYARTTGGDKTLVAGLESNYGNIQYASTTIKDIHQGWKKYTFTFKTQKGIDSTAEAHFVLLAKDTGTYWLDLVSVFPPTYEGTPNGNRKDIMNLLNAMHPSFLRFPGGNYLEGHRFAERFAWKKTIGPLKQRPGHQSPWGYWSNDGLGLLEYLEWCEDLDMEPLLAVFAGYTLNHDHVEGDYLKPFIRSALDEIQYVMGDKDTKWGAVRAKNGHPEPFPLHYVEIGNEDWFDGSGSYAKRFTQFYHAIKVKYPKLKIISTESYHQLKEQAKAHEVDLPEPDVIDEHYYRNAWQMEEDANHYNHYNREGPEILVGEWATREGSPTTNFNAALGDAAWMTGMEKNSDIVVMSCYAPLFVNVNPGGMQWRSDLIGYNTLKAYGSPSYYAQKMFNTHIGNEVVPIQSSNIPSHIQKLSAKEKYAGKKPEKVPGLFYVATKNTETGTIYLKIVNVLDHKQPVQIHLKGNVKVKRKGLLITLHSDDPEATNSITDRKNIVPVKTDVKGLSNDFTHTFLGHSINILEIRTK